MGPTIAFSVSLVALVLFLMFKFFEQSRTLSVYTNLREKGDEVVMSAVESLRRRSARLGEHLSISNVAHFTVHHTASAVARTARRVEDGAQNITLKMTRNGKARATESSFLKEVSTHKEGLDTERVRRETSLTEDLE